MIFFKPGLILKLNRLALTLLLLTIFGHLLKGQPVIEPPVIDSISVDTAANGVYHCVLGWEPYDWSGYDIDSSGFIVRDVIPGSGYANPDTIFNANATFYMDYSSDPLNEIQGYGLVAFSVVNGEFLKSEIEDQFSRNIRLQVVNYDSCTASVSLSWNDYYSDEAPSGTEEPAYTLKAISATDSRVAATTVNSYTFENLNREEIYQFRLIIDPDGFTSSSNPVNALITTPEEPSKPYIETLSNSENFITTGAVYGDEIVTDHMLLMGSIDPVSGYDTVDEFYVENRPYTFSESRYGENITYYYIAAFNSCGINPVYSDTINTIVLSAADNGDYISLQANGLGKSDVQYRLYRQANGETTIFDPGSEPILYDDYSVFDLTLSNPGVRYYIEARLGDSVIVKSNPVEVKILDDLLWPNAIIAGEPGMDGAFKAIPQRSLPASYNLRIYNKWGDLIFETNDIDNPWRGRYKGSFVMSGGYLYVATYKFPGKKEKVIRGTVTVIH
ncbi:MAG TPA: gliding motility-associated C-terminal domain-containing protein [Salinivirga sp.]|uniref:T9SS type B sorting domain-containing protein n=1 Tax=Salinivirga sp. TaxID=1970192 RepID=UPI002B48A262|nr:gliding motility-associated C-terminal domain-containing protein [Salinivirga sp.]HKK59880.1 gliding motility-associated C-terminal domain-containing protein [Salinivirga sp.]